MFFVVYWINDDESENFLIKLKICRKQKKNAIWSYCNIINKKKKT